MTIYPKPVVGLNVSQNPVCAGIMVNFTASNANTYVFQKNGITIQSGASANYSSSALNNNDKVLVIGTNLNGCIDTSSMITMAVKALPVVGLNASTINT
jgi:hypothetical protein